MAYKIGLETHDIHKQLSADAKLRVLASRLPSLNDCVVTKHSCEFRRFLSTVSFSNEDNCCQLQGIGKLIKEELSKGIFKID